MRKWLNEKGFTLVELMAVLAILALIVAIAVPAVGSVLAKSKESATESSIELMERAGELAYLDDLAFDETAPKSESYWVASLKDEGYLKMESVDESLYVTKKGSSGEFVASTSDGASVATPSEPVVPELPNAYGFVNPVKQIETCEEARAAGYDRCVTTVSELKKMADYPTASFILLNDLDMTGELSLLRSGNPIFRGVLDGNGYALKNLTRRVFDVEFYGEVKNLAVLDADIPDSGSSGSSALIRISGVTTVVDNVVVTGTIKSTNSYIGLIVGNNNGVIRNSRVDGLVSTSGGYVGGIAGFSDGSIENSHSSAVVKGAIYNSNESRYVGGLVGMNVGTVTNSSATGSVTGRDFVGGLIGRSTGPVTDVSATGDVSGRLYVGGLIGDNTGSVTDAHATSYVSGLYDQVGGLIGINKGALAGDLSASGDVQGRSDTGGLIGYTLKALPDKARASGNVVGQSSNIGGLVGRSDVLQKPATGIYATGDVYGDYNVGGAFGLSTGDVYKAHARGAVQHRSGGGGGLIGRTYGDIRESSFIGTIQNTMGNSSVVTGGLAGYTHSSSIQDSYVRATFIRHLGKTGGIVGNSGGIVSTSYAVTNLPKAQFVDGLVAYKDSSVGNTVLAPKSYWLTPNSDSSHGEGLTLDEFKQQSSFKDWDFTNIWKMGESGYPEHR